MSEELKQLHMHDTFKPLDPKTLSKVEYDNVLELHLFLKEKHNDTIKGQIVTDDNKQCGTINKQEATSPMAALKSVLLTAVIDAAEEQDVVSIDIPNAFIQTKIKDENDHVVL